MTVLSTGVVHKKGCRPRSKTGTIICVQLENKTVLQHPFNLITKEARMAGVDMEQSI